MINKIFLQFSAFLCNKTAVVVNLNVWGFSLFFFLCLQIITGFMLALAYIPDVMLIASIKEEEDMENLFIDDFWWLHEYGVSIIFILLFLHIFFKLFLGVVDLEIDASWKSGALLFLGVNIITFCGLILGTTHLSDVTLSIATNTLRHILSLFMEIPFLVFTNNELNTDTLIRIMWLHYISPIFLIGLLLNHTEDIHYDWKADNSISGIKQVIYWWDETFAIEMLKLKDFILILFFSYHLFILHPDAISYELFTWGDLGLIVDVRYYGVAPHWYFRPYMSWLVVCPHTLIGLFFLFNIFFIFYHQTTLFGVNNLGSYKVLSTIYCSFNYILFFFIKAYVFSYSLLNIKINYYIRVKYYIYFLYYYILFLKLMQYVWDKIKLDSFCFYILSYMFSFFFLRFKINFFKFISLVVWELCVNFQVLFFNFICYINTKFYYFHTNILGTTVYYFNYQAPIDPLTSSWFMFSFGFFLIAICYVFSFLPYGRFYSEVGGNYGVLLAFLYIYLYLLCYSLRNSWFINTYKLNILN